MRASFFLTITTYKQGNAINMVVIKTQRKHEAQISY